MNVSKRRTLAWLGALALAAVMFASACKKEYIENRQEVCFQQEVLPIFQSSCTQSGCHNSQTREAGYDFSNYDGILKSVKPGDYKASKVYKIITTSFGIMPPSPYDRLSDEKITTIALWIKQGAQNNSCQVAACDTTSVTLSGSVMPIFDNYCNGCHSGSQPQGNINLTNYTGIKATVNDGTLLGSVKHSSGYVAMPESGSKLSDCNIAKIEKWIALGAKND
ncbi:MAG: hypothetical protein GC192_14625 [Bacteroidetes bacterium]|nr:hypothetical protein [Bacteroidota bacterium]